MRHHFFSWGTTKFSCIWWIFCFSEVLFGFLAYQYPCHVALSMRPDVDLYCNTIDVLLETAKCVHRLVLMLPPDVIMQLERAELLWERGGQPACCLFVLFVVVVVIVNMSC